mmetsp:Transcript_37546/g.103593  ORF Transcript_37546/g.103593 Transcript_37546/m.103593 type:complete len:91 (+) Transcript_37546:171-443(+)
MRVGGTAKHALEQLEDVLEADVHLELLLPCQALDSRQLIPPDMALPAHPDGGSTATGRSAAGHARRRRGAAGDAGLGEPDETDADGARGG